MKFTAEQVQAAIDALAGGDGAAALDILKALLTEAASGGESAAGTPPAEAGATAGNADEPPAPEMAALARGVIALFNAAPGAALELVKSLKAADDARQADAAVLEVSERRALVGELVTLGVEVPGTAWEDPDAKVPVPVARLAGESIADLRKRVSTIRSVRGKLPARGHTPPVGETPAPRKLSRAELAYCEKHKITPEQFQARARDAVRVPASRA